MYIISYFSNGTFIHEYTEQYVLFKPVCILGVLCYMYKYVIAYLYNDSLVY